MSVFRLTEEDGAFGAVKALLEHIRVAREHFDANRPEVSPFADGFARQLRLHEERLMADLAALEGTSVPGALG